jgi:hypothetical protein
MIDSAHAAGLTFWPWTIDDTSSMRAYIAKKVDGIITNYPQDLIALESPTSIETVRPAPGTPSRLTLDAYPNPFNPTTVIRYTLPERTRVQIDVFTPLGAHVARLSDTVDQPAGTFEIPFNATPYSSGLYFVRIQTPHASATIRCLCIK